MDKSGKGGKGSSDKPPIKKIIKKGGGHHGGSWKVAYADFVTAMMAFFLLMWLLGSVDDETRAGIASYFQRPLKDIMTQGAYSGGDRAMATSDGSPRPGFGAPGTAEEVAEAAVREAMQVEEVEQAIAELIQSDSVFARMGDQLLVEMTPEGLRIQLVDKEHRSMFARGSSVLEPFARKLLVSMAPLLDSLSNPIILTGHTDATAYAGQNAGYSNWELSVDRANAARRALVDGGLPAHRLLRVEGLAASVPAKPEEPLDASNRRISLLLLNRATADSYRRAHTYH